VAGQTSAARAATAVREVFGWHRRTVLALLAGVAVLAGLSAVAPHHGREVRVWVAARDLSGGTPLRVQDVVLRALPAALAPRAALTTRSHVLGRLLAAPVRRGEPLTDVRLLAPSLLAALPEPGLVAVPVRVADGPAAASVVHPGALVDVLASTADSEGDPSSAVTVVASVLVVAVPPPEPSDGGEAGLVVVAASPAQANALAAASGRRLSVVLRQ
jgi:pilus assembly protein CpaB